MPRTAGEGVLPRLSLKMNLLWTMAGNVTYAGCQWGMLVALAKLTNPEQVGQFALALAITAPVLMLANLGLRGAQATDARSEFLFGDYLGLRLITSSLAVPAIVLLAALPGYPRDTALVILVVGLAKVFESISDVFYGLLQQHERMDRIAISMIGKGILSLLVLALAVYLTRRVVWGAVGLASIWILILAVYDLRSGRLTLAQHQGSDEGSGEVEDGASTLKPLFVPHELLRLAWLALPLGIVMLLISLNANIPRYFIEHDLGVRQLGFFAAIAYLMVAGNTVIIALGQSASPRLAQYYALRNMAAFRSLLLKLVVCGVSLAAIGILLAALGGRPILLLLYRPEYAQHTDVLVWLMVATGIFYAASFLGYGLSSARHFRIQVPLIATTTLTIVLACWILIPRFHLLGAALGLVCGMGVELLLFTATLLWVLHRSERRIGIELRVH